MPSRDPSDLSQSMQNMHRAFHERCAHDEWLVRNGITVQTICTFRSIAEQDALYKQGRDGNPGPIVTKAKGGQSHHNATDHNGRPAAEAFDVVPLRQGRAVWGTKGDGIDLDDSDDHKDDLEVWQHVGENGVAVGLKWYGTPGSEFKEFPHFQNPMVGRATAR